MIIRGDTLRGDTLRISMETARAIMHAERAFHEGMMRFALESDARNSDEIAFGEEEADSLMNILGEDFICPISKHLSYVHV